jgi:hypothetical protein
MLIGRLPCSRAAFYTCCMGDEVMIRTMSREELGTAVEWAAREGWNPGLDDAEAFYAADPEGFLQVEDDGEVVGTISAVKYGADFGFVGFYIVKPGRRGRRYGWLLAEQALARLEGCRIGVDGVLNKQRQYAKFFGLEFAYRNLRYAGVVTGRAAGAEVVSAGEIPFAAVAAYDRRFFPAERETFLRAWLGMPQTMSLGWMSDGKLRGYGVIRQCREGFKIGPLFADDVEIAEALFLALCERAEGQPVFLDVPEVNPAAVQMALRHGMREVFATARMYRGGVPNLPVDGIFGVTTFELG